jgi:hypothetical protein
MGIPPGERQAQDTRKTRSQGERSMADQEQLELLKQGVKIWNQWAGELRPHQSLIPIQLLTRSFLTLLLLEQPLEPVVEQLVDTIVEGIRVREYLFLRFSLS